MSTEADLPRLDLNSPTLSDTALEALQDIVPAAFGEDGRIDFDKLRALLGDRITTEKERYTLTWAGKSEAMRAVQTPATGTLEPMPDESVDFDTTGNVIIEGDNLEVLKLLQKSYHGKVKMIYIDPPYNTGNDFIYPDNFREGLQTYLEYTGQAKKKVSESVERENRAGRVHSNWLNMMYPRLVLARNLLREDGVIFVSIDDHEVHNLRLLLDEIYGEDNFLAQIVWKSRQFTDARATSGLSTDHEYLIVYTRVDGFSLKGVPRDESKFSNPDGDPRGDWMSRSILGLANRESRPNLHFPITDPTTGLTYTPPADTGWRYNQARLNQMITEGRVIFPRSPDGRPREKKFRAELGAANKAFPSVITDVFTSHGTKDVRELFGLDVIQFPKPSKLLQSLMSQALDEEDIVLDFFAGSGTTAHAMLNLNHEDGGNRRYILVQLPEPLEPAIMLDDGTRLSTIADITRERARRAAKQLTVADEERLDLARTRPDLGFRAFRLTSSNFRPWEDMSEGDADQLASQLRVAANNLLDSKLEALLIEILLASGHELSVPIEPYAGGVADTFSVNRGQLLVCLSEPLDEAALTNLLSSGAKQIVCLDHAFRGNDALKANIAQQVKQLNVCHPDVRIDLRTV